MTNIEWTDATWNPVTGCTKVSAGCRNCYAETVADRFWGKQYGTVDGERRRFTDVWTHPERLDEPLRWRKPRRVFVNSMSDLFHEAVPDEFIDRVFAVMAISNYVGRCRARDCQHEPCESVDKPLAHSFQVLTKRPDRMRVYVRTPGRIDAVAEAAGMLGNWYIGDGALDAMSWPLPNVWLGVSAENQKTADERIPILLDTPAAVRFVSAEPLLGPIDLGLRKWEEPRAPWPSRWIRTHRPIGPDLPHLIAPVCDNVADAGVHRAESNRLGALSVRTPGGLLGIKPSEFECLGTLDWIIVGGESGPAARPCDVVWIRRIVDQCRDAGVPVFVKQLGAQPRNGEIDLHIAVQDSKGGDPSEWPEDLRVREFPK